MQVWRWHIRLKYGGGILVKIWRRRIGLQSGGGIQAQNMLVAYWFKMILLNLLAGPQ